MPRWALSSAPERNSTSLSRRLSSQEHCASSPRWISEGSEKMATGFAKWQIVIGQGLTKRTLKAIEVTQKPKD